MTIALLGALAACAAPRVATMPAPPARIDPEPPAPEPAPELPGRVVVTETDMEILDPIRFEPNSVELTDKIRRSLDSIADTLGGNPSILLVEIRAHADRGEDDPTLLAYRRSEVVMAYLIAHGVLPARLMKSEAADAEMIGPIGAPENRRIDVLIVDRDND